jgi:crotonobetainyl-CoA:carnitine CoA-transferase CaiB-like acyl-CoA transferase
MTRYALEGVRVLDFSWVGVGPVATKYLADNGADVIRVESATHPDVLRMAPPWKDAAPGVNRSQFFASYNTSKRSLALDLSQPKAREIALRLVGWAEVVVESFTPRVLRRYGLEYDSLRKLKPELVMLSTCLQGQTGPRAEFPGFGQLMSGLSGFYYISGYSPDSLCPPYGAYTDFVSTRFVAIALLSALAYRRRTGRGQYIDLAQYEASLHNLAPALVDYFATGRVLTARANRSERYAPHGAYRCADEDGQQRWIALAVGDDAQWRALMRVLGQNHDQPRFATMRRRLNAFDELDHLIAALVRAWQAEELVERLQANGVPAYRVQSCTDLHGDPNLAAFGFWHWLDHKEMGPSPYEGFQHRLSRTPGELRSPAPLLGEHSAEVLSSVLGLSPEEIEELKRTQVLL